MMTTKEDEEEKKMIGMEKNILYTQLNYVGERKRTGNKIEKEKNREKRMCVICFLLYNALGFGKEDEKIRGKKEERVSERKKEEQEEEE